MKKSFLINIFINEQKPLLWKFNLTSLLRADSKQSEFYKIMLDTVLSR